MSTQNLNPAAQSVEAQLARKEDSSLSVFLRQESLGAAEINGLDPSSYDLYLIRRNCLLGDEVIGPKRLHVGNYSEEVLYGTMGSSMARFRSVIRNLNNHAEKILSLDPEEVEFGHQISLLWSEIGALKEFVGVSQAISEIVAEFRTARFQFLKKDTPAPVVHGLASALRLVDEAERLDISLVDQLVQVMEIAGIDSFAPDAIPDPNE